MICCRMVKQGQQWIAPQGQWREERKETSTSKSVCTVLLKRIITTSNNTLLCEQSRACTLLPMSQQKVQLRTLHVKDLEQLCQWCFHVIFLSIIQCNACSMMLQGNTLQHICFWFCLFFCSLVILLYIMLNACKAMKYCNCTVILKLNSHWSLLIINLMPDKHLFCILLSPNTFYPQQHWHKATSTLICDT